MTAPGARARTAAGQDLRRPRWLAATLALAGCAWGNDPRGCAYCRTGEGCRSVYDTLGSWCPLAERALARHAQGPLLFEAIPFELGSPSSRPPCASGEAWYTVRLHVFDREGDFEGDVRAIEADGSLRSLGEAAPLRADGSIAAVACAPAGAGGAAIGFVVIDAAGHRSNPLCVTVGPN